MAQEDVKHSEFGARISRIIGDRSIRALAKEAGIAPGTLQNLVAHRHVPRADVLKKLSRCLGLDGHWLLTGEGTPYRQRGVEFAPDIHVVTASEWEDGTRLALQQGGFYGIPLLKDPIKAGEPRTINAADFEECVLVHRNWCRHPASSYALRVKGDSMVPTLPEGSIITMDTSERNPESLDGKVAIVRHDDAATVKRIRLGEKRVLCVPDNITRENRAFILDTHAGDGIIGRVVSVHAEVR